MFSALKKYDMIIREYFQNPFIWLGISFLILKNLEPFLGPVREFRTLLWVNDLNWVFFIPTLFMSMAMMIVPFIDSIIQMIRENQGRKFAILFVITIVIMYLGVGVYYKIEIITIMTQQFKEIITDEDRVNAIENCLLLSGFVIMPILERIIRHSVIKEFTKQHLQFISIRWNRLMPISWMMFISLLIGFWVVNIHIFHKLS